MNEAEGRVERRNDGHLIKVLEVLDGGEAFLGRTSNGGTAWFSLGEVAGLSRGDVIFVGDSIWKKAPSTAWPDTQEVAIVRRMLERGVLVEAALGIRLLPPSKTVSVELGNTVLFNEIDGITAVLHAKPIRSRDIGVDDDTVDEYLVGRDGESNLTLEAFGGYREVRDRAVELIETQLDKRSKLDAIGARPVKGVIFTGPPGTGKTYLARIIAHASKATFYLVSGPSIVSKWVGDSEDTLRRIFDAAKEDDRAIIFFDEIDSIAERRSGDTHEASKRLVAQLLTLLDGFDQGRGNVVVLAATNRIEVVDPALLRPGRFDWEIRFGLPTLEDRLDILKVGTRGLEVQGSLPLQEIAERTEGWSAARLSSIWTESALVAAGDDREFISGEDLAQGFERVVIRPSYEIKKAGNVA